MASDELWQTSEAAFRHTFGGSPWDVLNQWDEASARPAERWRAWRSPVLAQPELSRLFYRGISNHGDSSRMLGFARKLIDGKHVRIAAVGGSVTNGGFGENGYVTLLGRWLAAALPHQGRVDIIGAAASGATVDYTARCQQATANNIDLVVFEHAINLGSDSDGLMLDATLEGLLRSFNGLASQPAVLMFNWFLNPIGRAFHTVNGEARFDTLSRYYGLPSFSFNAALHEMLSRNASRCRTGCQPGPALERIAPSFVWYDGRHPTAQGYGFMAAVLITLLVDAMRIASSPHSAEGAVPALAGNPPPLFLTPSAALAADEQLSFERRRCLTGRSLHAAVLNASGFKWTVERSRAGNAQPGFVSLSVGDMISFDVGSTPTELIAIGYLRSYKDVGTATARCHGTCKCDDMSKV